MLLTSGNPDGTFLVRLRSKSNQTHIKFKDTLSLSLRDGEGVKHYHIMRLDDGSYYIAPRAAFQTLKVNQQLIYNVGYRNLKLGKFSMLPS